MYLSRFRITDVPSEACLFCLHCVFFHNFGNNTQLLNLILTVEVNSKYCSEGEVIPVPIQWLMQSRSCLRLFVPGSLNEEHMASPHFLKGTL